MWKSHMLLEIVILNRRSQFVVEYTKELNSMLEIETKSSTVFHPQTDKQIEYIKQELE